MDIGKISESILKRSVLRQLKTKRNEVINGAAVGEDCAIFKLPPNTAMASCTQEGVVKIGLEDTKEEEYFAVPIEQMIVRCVNNLAAKGAKPVAMQISLLLPQSMEEAQLKGVIAQAEKTGRLFFMQISGGQTLISNAVKAPVATITGYGILDDILEEVSLRRIQPGQDIVLSKWIGLEGTAILAKKRRESLCTRYPRYFIEEATEFDQYLSVLPEALVAVKAGVCGMHDASKGGIFAALWELAEGASVGMTVDLKKLPLRQETVEVCEYCNCNPYELLSGGCLVMTAWEGDALVHSLEEQGILATVVGKITEGKERILINEDEVRYMERPKRDEIYRVLTQ